MGVIEWTPVVCNAEKMTFAELVKSNAWLSVKMVLSKLHPDQEEFMDDYQHVFSQLQVITSLPSNVTIDVGRIHDSYDNAHYVDVSGYYTNPVDRTNEYTNSLAIEYTPWNKWFGMPIDKNSLKNFSELEIIAHCLIEMTYAGFEQEDIQSGIDRIKGIKEEYDNLTPEENKQQTISLNDLKAKYDTDSDKEQGTDNKDKKNV